ncbi:MAG TPA: hypothetical protein VFV38_29565 [Ktedonobacteraceae bacterium]|nr:hypothetical protein [Ktedonobacteraceae bacterium]HEU5379592.1 hypothetical protein [Ktedonobacteraceae bacterium]
MDEQEAARHIASLEARMQRIETLLQQLILTLTSSRAQIDQIRQMQAILQELRRGHTP